MSRHLDEDETLDLLLELLPPERERLLLDHVIGCRLCEESMRRQGAEIERIASGPAGESRDRAALPLAGEAAPGLRATPLRPRGSLARGLRGAWTKRVLPVGSLAVALAMAIILLLPRERLAPLQPEPNWLPSGTSIVQRQASENEAEITALAEGLEAYGRRDLPLAIDRLERGHVSDRFDSFRRLYLGSALALSGDFTSAASTLRPLRIAYLPEPWATEGYWTLLVALERGGRTSEADSLRRALVEEPGEIGERVRRLSKRSR